MKQTHRIIGFVAGALAPVSAAWAQLSPKPGNLNPESMTTWTAYGIVFVLVGCVLIGAFRSSKRSHLD